MEELGAEVVLKGLKGRPELNGCAATVVEYRIADLGHIRYYLAPKIDDEA